MRNGGSCCAVLPFPIQNEKQVNQVGFGETFRPLNPDIWLHTLHFNSVVESLEVAWPILFAVNLRPLWFLLTIPPGGTLFYHSGHSLPNPLPHHFWSLFGVHPTPPPQKSWGTCVYQFKTHRPAELSRKLTESFNSQVNMLTALSLALDKGGVENWQVCRTQVIQDITGKKWKKIHLVLYQVLESVWGEWK